MSRAFGIGFMLIALWVGLSVWTDGLDRAFDGWFAPIGAAEADAGPADPNAASEEDATEATRPRKRVFITEQVRQRVSGHMERGAERTRRAAR